MTIKDNVTMTAQSCLLYPEAEDSLICGVMNRLLEGQNVVWEETIKLKVKPRPKYIPESVWGWLVNLVLIQEYRRGEK